MDNDTPIGFYFKLTFKDQDIAFQEVSGISKEFSIEEVASGGENQFKYRLPTVSSSENLVLRRAIVPPDSLLVNWYESCINQGLSKSDSTRKCDIKFSQCKRSNNYAMDFS
jgi:phage tail-like protein